VIQKLSKSFKKILRAKNKKKSLILNSLFMGINTCKALSGSGTPKKLFVGNFPPILDLIGMQFSMYVYINCQYWHNTYKNYLLCFHNFLYPKNLDVKRFLERTVYSPFKCDGKNWLTVFVVRKVPKIAIIILFGGK